MISKAFVQYDINTRLPTSEAGYAVSRGCYYLGIEVEPFYLPADIRTKVAPDTLVHGGVSAVKSALRYLGIEPPWVPDAPECLKPLFHRNLWETTWGEFRQRKTSDPVFVKPLRAQKAFTGLVFRGTVADLVQTASIPDDMGVLCSDPVDFESEFRVFVHRGLIADVRPYAGDPLLFPDWRVIRSAVKAFKGAPCGYSLDVGVLSTEQTAIVEVNDGFALGSYGMAYLPYTQMVIDRWEEMVASSQL